MMKRLTISACVLPMLCLCITPSAASLTPVNPIGANSGAERCLADAQCPDSGIYAGAQSLLDIFETAAGKGAFTRIDDTLDKAWKAAGGQPMMIRAVARYAGDSSVVGIDAGSGYRGFTQTTIADGKVRVDDPQEYARDPRPGDFSAFPADGGWSWIALATGQHFAFALKNLTEGYKLSSNPVLRGYANSGKHFLDYMVTWRVNDTIPHYFIAWEDRDPRSNSTTDHDYNDLVFEVLYGQPLLIPDAPVSTAPEPATLALLLLGFPLVVSLARRRRLTG